jgi:hypothetical protein
MTAAPVLAQSNAQARADARAEAIARQQRYEISTLERVFEGAVEHGISVVRDRLQAVAQMPAELLISDNAHARGFRLEGYGVFFDVTVPIFDATLWTLRTLDQNDLGFDSAMKELQQIVKGNVNAEQALRRVELQVTQHDRIDRRGRRRSFGAQRQPGSDPRRTERSVPDRGDCGAEGSDAEPQQLARDSGHRMADDCCPRQRRPASSRAG